MYNMQITLHEKKNFLLKLLLVNGFESKYTEPGHPFNLLSGGYQHGHPTIEVFYLSC